MTRDSTTRNSAEWFDFGTLVSKEANGRLYEVIANGTFRATAPNGDYIKTIDSAESWLVDHGITNDKELTEIMDYENEDGWVVDMTRWFDLIVSVPHGDGWMEQYCGEPEFEYDEEFFLEWIGEAVKQDAEEEE